MVGLFLPLGSLKIELIFRFGYGLYFLLLAGYRKLEFPVFGDEGLHEGEDISGAVGVYAIQAQTLIQFLRAVAEHIDFLLVEAHKLSHFVFGSVELFFNKLFLLDTLFQLLLERRHTI